MPSLSQTLNIIIYLQMFVRIQTYKKQKWFLNALVKVSSKQNYIVTSAAFMSDLVFAPTLAGWSVRS